jgi:hypothetical protein
VPATQIRARLRTRRQNRRRIGVTRDWSTLDIEQFELMTIGYRVPHEWLEQVAAVRQRDCYRCDDPAAVEVPIENIESRPIGPGLKGFVEWRLYDVILALKNDIALPPIIAFQRPNSALLIEGNYRYWASKSCGYLRIPTRFVSRKAAEAFYKDID